MGDRTAFFYGTLMAPQVLHRVIHGTSTPTPHQLSVLSIHPAILPSYCRHKALRRDYPAIIPAPPSHTVRGTLVRGLSDADLWRLDIFEGDEYERQKVRVRVLVEVGDARGVGNVEGEEEVEAETYVWVRGEGELEGGEWDFEVFRREKMGRWVGGGDEYFGEFEGGAGGASLLWVRSWWVGVEVWLTLGRAVEVDEAVGVGVGDLTGGRGVNGVILGKLEGKEEEEVLENAV